MRSRHNSWRNGRQSGLTLIEVVVAIAIAGTLLVSTLAGLAAHQRQVRSAERKAIALDAVDRFLSIWSASGFRDASIRKAATKARVRLATDFADVELLSTDDSDSIKASLQSLEPVISIRRLPHSSQLAVRFERLLVQASWDSSRDAAVAIEILRAAEN